MSHQFYVLTVFPEMVTQMCSFGVIGQAQKKGLIRVNSISLREFTNDVHRSVDDRPFGGGDGMVLLAEPLKKAIEHVQHGAKCHVIHLSPQGKLLDHGLCQKLTQNENILLLCGRYGGIDQRVINTYVGEEISIGNYVISGGELAAGVLIDAVSRQIPGVLGHEESADNDSFSKGWLECPSFTRSREELSQSVPEILLSGNHAAILQWRHLVSGLVTLHKRPELMLNAKGQLGELKKFWLTLSPSDREVLGISKLEEKDFQ